MIKNIIPVEIEGKTYNMAVNVGSMLDVERISGKNFMTVLKETGTGDITPTAVLLAACLKRGNKPVGMDFISQLDFEKMQELLPVLMESIGKSFPKSEEKNEEPTQIAVN